MALPGLALYGVVLGPVDPLDHDRDWGSAFYPLPLPPMPTTAIYPTCLHRGYVATFVLRAEGSLELRSYLHGPPGQPPATHPVGLALTGDFWVVLKPEFCGLRTYVPFQAGRVVVDRASWIFETEDVRDERRRAWRARRHGGAG